jgi:DNA-binding GntR family transcriptional regulator
MRAHTATISQVASFETARSRAARLYAELHADILKGALRPGEVLSEARIGEQWGISRTPVREVFQRLAKEGLLRVVPQIGTFVAPINLSSVNGSQFIREALECRAVRFAAERATRVQIAGLRKLVAQQAQAIKSVDHVAFFSLDEVMHRAILDIAGQPLVWGLIASVKAQLDRVRYLSLEDHSWLTMIFRQHREITGRIADHDAAGAEHAMQQHLRTVFDAIARIAGEHPEFFEQDPSQPAKDIA